MKHTDRFGITGIRPEAVKMVPVAHPTMEVELGMNISYQPFPEEKNCHLTDVLIATICLARAPTHRWRGEVDLCLCRYLVQLWRWGGEMRLGQP